MNTAPETGNAQQHQIIPFSMTNFEDIRPYHDEEVPAILARLLKDEEFIGAICGFKLSNKPAWLQQLLKPIVRRKLARELAPLRSVRDVQQLIERYVVQVIETSTHHLSFSGLDNLHKGQPYLFISNHRDIVMDPAFVNFALYHHGLETPELAIGDNLLKKPFVADLMRLNKSFIVKRSASGVREKMAAFSNLSAYVQHTLASGNSVWIAQKEGRAKDGIDRTDPAIIKMFYMSQKKSGLSFSDYINWLKIVPVSISYEYNPCDQMISRELYETATTGNYQKAEGEDDRSIVTGIVGQKGDVHIAFGEPLQGLFNDAEQVAEVIDQQILANYRLHTSNYTAAHKLYPDLNIPAENIDAAKHSAFMERLQTCDSKLQDFYLQMYANPVLQRANASQAVK